MASGRKYGVKVSIYKHFTVFAENENEAWNNAFMEACREVDIVDREVAEDSYGPEDGDEPWEILNIYPTEIVEKRGGSKKGKRQGKWPWIIKVVTHAIKIRSGGSEGKGGVSGYRFKTAMCEMLPGVETWLKKEYPKHSSEEIFKLIENRYVYMYRDSDGDHCPDGSNEHWKTKFPCDSNLAIVHDLIINGQAVQYVNWKDLLGVAPISTD